MYDPNGLFLVIYLLSGIIALSAGLGAWFSRRRIAAWFRKGGGLAALDVANAANNAFEVRVKQLENDVKKLQDEAQLKDEKIKVLTELVTSRSKIDEVLSSMQLQQDQMIRKDGPVVTELLSGMTALLDDNAELLKGIHQLLTAHDLWERDRYEKEGNK